MSPRIRAAVLAAMLNPERRETVERLLDNPEGYNALINGLMQSAANLAELANKPEYDLSGELSQAVELFVETRDKGQTVDEFAAQTDMFREAPSAETMFLMRLFEENAKSSGGISGVLRQYAAECKKIDTTTQSLFGDENPTKLEKLEEAYRHYAADLSSEAGNGNLRWRDTGEPAAEEISEAQKQYEEVKSKYMGTPLWMKAPNGKPTNLTESQWIEVRTPNFKRWVDDWEMLAEAYPEHEIFDIDEAYKFARGNLQGGEFTSKDGHTATLGRSGIDKMNSGLARGKTGNNRLHALAFANVGKLFENSELLEAEPQRDGDSNIKQYLKFYAPLYLDGRFYVVKITARELYSGNKLYSLEGLDIIEESEYRGQPRGSKENSISADYSDSVKNFVRKIREVKGNVSKVVDENGEPKVVYHGTDNTNPDYTRFTVFKHSDPRVKKYVHFFSSSRDVAGSMGSYVYDVFLNIKNPLIIDAGGNSWGAIKDHTNGRVKFSDLTDEQKKKLCRIFDCTMKELESSYRADSEIDLVQAGVIKRDERSTNEWADYARANGYDGVIFRNLRDGAGYDVMQNSSDVFAVYNSNQIKSATDNIGTYSENPDIRWRIEDDEALERIKSLSSADIEGIMDEAERVVADNLKESKGRSAARVEADREKYIRDNMSKWEEGGDEDFRYYRNPKAYEISESGGEYKVEDDDGNELDFFTELEDAKRYALERRWEDDVYDELDYKEDLYEDNPQNAMRKQFEYALRKIGIEIVNSTGGTFNGSEYIYLELPNGEEKKIRFADHPQVYSADMSVEEDWRAAFKFFVERVQREDWTEENYPDNIRWKIDDPSPERVEKLRAARPVEIGENDYKGLYELNAKSAREYVLKKLRGRKYVNADTGDEIEIGQVGARKITTHDRYNKDYLRTFAAIPQMIENAVYLGEEPNEKGNSKYDKYRYYACGLKIGGRDYTARLTIGERNGKWYYDQALTEMEKGDLIEQVPTQASVLSARGSPNGFIDNRLISLLQENNSENSSRLRFLLRQDRRENPVIWASIVLAKQILLGRAITNARLDRVLPPERFDGTKREYAVNRAREIAERYRADKEKFGNDLNLGVQRAENDLYWTRDVVEEMYASFRRDGEEYGIARQRLMEWLKEQRRRDLETVKGLSSEELGIDVPAAIEDALEKEPERRKPGENTAEESGEETFEASGEGIDAEIESAREKPAPSTIRDIIGKIRAGVTKAAKARGMDEAARRRAYRNTLAEVLRESAKRLTYGREREAIMKKISDLSAKGYSVIKIKDGERAGQKIDNYTLRAEHIALRIFNRGVRDTKRELSEKFEKIVSRKGKKPSRMERDDKRALAGAVQLRVYNIKRYSEMDAAELEAEYSATVDRLENVEKNFAERIRHYGAFAKAISKEIRKRAAIVQYGLPPFPASDTIQYRPLCGQSKRRKREQKSSNPKMRCITCESDKTLARLISIKLDLSLYASAPDSYCHASLAA